MVPRLVLFLLVAALAVVIGFFTIPPGQAVVIVRHAGYWVMLTIFALFLVYTWRSFRDVDWRGLWKREGRWVGFVVLAAGLLHLHEPHGIKIMSDEAVLNCTAMQMHFERDSALILRAYDVAGNFTPSLVLLDKRPLFFPFVVSLAHDLTGYRVSNALVVNALLSVALMGLLFIVGRKLAGIGGGILAVLMMASVPLVAQNATAAGFELLNMVMILLTLWYGMRLLERPNDDRMSAFVLSGVLLMQVRYESTIFLLPIAGLIIYTWFQRRAVWLPPVLIAAPMLLVLFPLQYSVFKLSESTWQLNDIPGATTPFGFQYFYDNVGHALAFFFTFDGTEPSSALVAVLGVLGIGLYVMLLYKQHRALFAAGTMEPAWVIFFVGLLIHTGLMLVYFWGRWDDPIIRRLSLPFHILLVLSFVTVFPRLVRWRWRWVAVCSVFVIYIFAFTLPWTAMHRYTKESVAGAVANWVNDFAAQYRHRKVLAIDVNNGFVWLLNRQATLTAGAVASRGEQFLYHYKGGTFDEVIVVQRISSDLETGVRWVNIEDDVGGGMTTEFITERQFGIGYWVRISRVKSVDDAKFREWAKTKLEELSKPKTEQPGTVLQREPTTIAEWVERLP